MMEQQPDPIRGGSDMAAFDMANLMVSGLAGKALTAELHRHFPGALRSQVYFAVGLATILLSADVQLAEAELAISLNGLG